MDRDEEPTEPRVEEPRLEERRVEEPRPPEEEPGLPAEDEAARADQEHQRELQKLRRRRVAMAVVGLALAAVLIIFILSNQQPVEVNFVFATRQPRLIWVMFACAVLGGIVGYIIGRPARNVRLHRRRE